jgi:hypothetical protein
MRGGGGVGRTLTRPAHSPSCFFSGTFIRYTPFSAHRACVRARPSVRLRRNAAPPLTPHAQHPPRRGGVGCAAPAAPEHPVREGCQGAQGLARAAHLDQSDVVTMVAILCKDYELRLAALQGLDDLRCSAEPAGRRSEAQQ